MDILRVKIFFNSGSKTLFLGSLVSGFNLVLCVGVGVRSFYSRIRLHDFFKLTEAFFHLICFSHVFVLLFSYSTPLFKRSFCLKLR
ncbi:hypothetical protein ACM25_06895 [Helicobacter pylori]|nr:hypothetical protein ACM25_06895 [Helicobacter pylori]